MDLEKINVMVDEHHIGDKIERVPLKQCIENLSHQHFVTAKACLECAPTINRQCCRLKIRDFPILLASNCVLFVGMSSSLPALSEYIIET